MRPQLPVAGIDINLGNDLAGCKVEVFETPVMDTSVSDVAAPNSVPLFPVCAVNHAQACKLRDLGLASPKLPFVWSNTCEFAFKAAKALHCSAPVLCFL